MIESSADPMTEAPAHDGPRPPAGAPHIVDELIEERATRLRRTPLWPLVRAFLYPLLGYRKAVDMADRIAPMNAAEVMEWVSGFLGMSAQTTGVEHVPETGPCVVISNHPGGITDGIIVWEALIARRPDLCFFANRDAVRVSAGLSELVIPVEWRAKARTRATARETLRIAIEAFKADRCVSIFPAGAMADWSWRRWGLREKPWTVTAVSLARKFNTPIVPLGVTSRMSFWFYAFDQVSEELRNMTVFHELLAKKGARYRLRFGEPIDPASLPRNEVEATEALKARCEELAWSKD